MLQAMNTGHDGSLTTVHANDTRDALSRLEMMVGMAGFDLPIWIIRRQISSAIQIVVQAARLVGGGRKIIKISEVTVMEGDVICMHDIFGFKQTGVDAKGSAQGHFYVSGIRPGPNGWRWRHRLGGCWRDLTLTGEARYRSGPLILIRPRGLQGPTPLTEFPPVQPAKTEPAAGATDPQSRAVPRGPGPAGGRGRRRGGPADAARFTNMVGRC